jgi:tetratricopeptide (TPR) repeat protein
VNIMSPIEVALSLADGEASPIQPSLPAPDSLRAEMAASFAPGPVESSPKRTLFIWGTVAVASILMGVAIAAILVASGKKNATEAARSLPSTEQAAAPAPARVAPSAVTPKVLPTSPKPASVASKVEAATTPELAGKPDFSGEVTVKAPTCEQIVGPSWSLLGGDQPGRAMAELQLGRRALMLGKIDDAQISFCRSATLDPTRPEAFQSLVRLLLLRRDPAQAREWAERAAKQHPDNQDVQGLYGDALARAGDVDRARSIWLESGRLEASDTAGARTMAITLVRGGDRSVRGADFAQADRLYRRAVLLDPLNGTAAAGLARVLLVQGETNAALQWARRAVAIEPRDAALHLMLGDVLEKTGDLSAARTEWKTAYDIDPHNFRAASRMMRVAK